MNKFTWLILALLVIALALSGCDDRTNVTTETKGNAYNGRVVGTLHGVITAQSTNTPISGVRVLYSMEGTNRETVSDVNGYYRIDNLHESTYSISFLSPDSTLANWGEIVVVKYDSANAHPTDVDFSIVIARNITLYRRNAGVQGFVYARMDNEVTVPAANAQVRATGFGGVLSADFVTTTNQSGFYTFTNLPAVPTATITAMPWQGNNVSFGAQASPVNLTSGATINAPNLTLGLAMSNVTAIANNFANGDFPVDQSLTITVNKPLFDSSLVITLTRGTTAVPFTRSLDATGMQLTIDPSVTLRTSSQYSVSVNGRSTDYATFTYGPVNFTTERGIDLIATSLWQQEGFPRNDIGIDEVLTFTFNRPININDPNNDTWIHRGTTNVLADRSFSDDHKTVSIWPLGSYRPNTQYTIGFLIYSTIAQDCTALSFNYRTIAPQNPPAQVTGFSNDDTAHVDWNTNLIWLKWNAMSNVSTYEVYGYDNLSVTDYRLINSFNPTTSSGLERFQVTLPTEFDWQTNDNLQTPFTNGIRVHFLVRAVNSMGEGPISSEVIMHDNVPPRVAALTRDSTFDNHTRNVPKLVKIRFSGAIEYCSSAVPTWQFIEAGLPGGDSNYVLPHDAASWSWDTASSPYRNGTLSIIIPASTNASMDSVKIYNIIDNSGNTQVIPAVIVPS